MAHRAPLAFGVAVLLFLSGCGGGSSTATTATTSKAPAVAPTTPEPSPVPGLSRQEASEKLGAVKKEIEKRIKVVKPVKPQEK